MSFEGAQPQLLNAIDVRGKFYFENTGKKLVVTAALTEVTLTVNTVTARVEKSMLMTLALARTELSAAAPKMAQVRAKMQKSDIPQTDLSPITQAVEK